MLLMIDETRTPALWAPRDHCLALPSLPEGDVKSDCIRIALVNNMPDAALEDTEFQFFELLNAAAGDMPVRLELFSLPGIPRGDRGREHLNAFYSDIKELLNKQYEGVIITGTEPHQSDLRKEPYWGILTDVLEWAEQSTVSTVLSCLAAHASVLHSDGIHRHPLPDKRLGVFNEKKTVDHRLTSYTTQPMGFPHSRWNEVQEDELGSCGYTVLTKSVEAGVNLFVKKKQNSLFVHFQGHPEYGVGTLAKEYRRDIKRFLRGGRQTYPSLPYGYFGETATKLLTDFQELALSARNQELMSLFPESVIVDALESPWRSSAIRVYRNWLHYLGAVRSQISGLGRMGRVARG